MKDLLGRLLGVRDLSLDDPSVRLEFAREWAPWVWAFFLLAAVGFAAWSYWKLVGRGLWRGLLAGARSLVLALMIVMLAGPQLVKQSERIEKEWVVVMVDRSASMRIADVPGDGSKRQARDAQLRQLLAGAAPTWKALAAERNVLFLGFDTGAYELKAPAANSPDALPADLGEPDGLRTNVGRSLEQALRRMASRPVAGIVLLSDGRSVDAVSRGLLRQLEARQVGVFPVALGGEKPIADFSVARVEAPSAAFLDDLVPVSVDVEARALGAPEREVRVELVDKTSGEVLGEAPATVREEGATRVMLSTRASREGRSNWTVRVSSGAADLSPDNDAAEVSVEVVGRPIRVVYFDGYPRWEFRYLKNLLLREKSIRASALLLSSEKRYIQDGPDPLQALPRSEAEWAPFDVIVMGDVRPSLFSDEQLRQVRESVSRRGAGLLWIAGSGATPSAWWGTPLADLLPFSAGNKSDSLGASVGMPTWLKPVVITPAPASDRFAVLRLGASPNAPWPQEVSDPSSGWSSLRWAQRLERESLKPTAEVLATAVAGDPRSSESESLPLVVTMRFGAGRVVYVATDEIWRLRYGRGETLPERFYVPLLRLLARDSLGRSGKPALLEVTPDKASIEQRVQITLRVLDQSLFAGKARSTVVRIAPRSGAAGDSAEVELRSESVGDDEVATTFTGVFVPSEPGAYKVEPMDAAFAGLDLSASFVVTLPQDELRDPQTNHELLRTLAEASGGKVLDGPGLVDLPRLLPNRQIRVVGASQIETLWDKPGVWILLMLLLCAEWIGRRLIRLS